MKTTYCSVAGCREHRIARWASNGCVLLGSGLVGIAIAIKFIGGIQKVQTIPLDLINLWMPIAMVLLAISSAIFLSLFERFEHSLTAIVFGASTPALLLGIASTTIPAYIPS